MLVDCEALQTYRDSCSVGPFVAAFRQGNPSVSSVRIFALFLNDGDPSKFKEKALSLHHMKIGWHTLMKIPLTPYNSFQCHV